MTTTDRLIELLRSNPGGLTCTEIGERLWGQSNVHRQSYARPAGKLLWIARRRGLVLQRWRGTRHVFYAARIDDAI